MPRKSRTKKPDSPAGLTPPNPTAIADVLADSPIKAMIEQSAADPEAAEALARFERQRQREQAVSEPPAEAPPKPRVKSWGETVRPWKGFGREVGVKHVTTTSPDMVGVQFERGKERTAEEKREMESVNLKFFTEAQAWLKPNRHGAFDETQALAERFAERRREMVRENEVQR